MAAILSMEDFASFCESWLGSWTGNKPERLLSFYGETAFYRDPAKPKGLKGHGELLPYFQKLLALNPDWVWRAVEIIPNPKGFVLKWEAKIPQGETVLMEHGLDIVEMKDGKITRNEVFFDPSRLKR
jgi:SnoaL-like domain